MGTYVYTVRSKKTNIHTSSGTIQANHLQYAHKDSTWWNFYDNGEVRRMQNIIERQKEMADIAVMKHKPKYVALISDKPENGDTVLHWEGKGGVWKDNMFLKDEDVAGYLKKVGKRWTMVDTREKALAVN